MGERDSWKGKWKRFTCKKIVNTYAFSVNIKNSLP